MSDTILSILIGILTGIISGLYTGLVMAKYSAFCQIRLEIVYLCRKFYVFAVNGDIDRYDFSNYENIGYAACNFIYLKHKSAGDDTFRLYKDITSTIMKIKNTVDRKKLCQERLGDDITAQEAFNKLREWQEKSIGLRPSKAVLFLPWGHL